MTIYQQQCLLGYLGYPPGPIDGLDGPNTQAALERFRLDYGLGAEGLVGAVAGTVAKRDNVTEAAGSDTFDTGGDTDTFWDGIKHFIREEFRCPCGKCGGFPVEPDRRIVQMADDLREHLGMPVTIIPLTGDPHAGGSGIRCRAYNATLANNPTPSVTNSKHIDGKAVDFSTAAPAEKVEAWLAAQKAAGKLRYWYRISNHSWHMDVQ